MRWKIICISQKKKPGFRNHLKKIYNIPAGGGSEASGNIYLFQTWYKIYLFQIEFSPFIFPLNKYLTHTNTHTQDYKSLNENSSFNAHTHAHTYNVL